MPKLSFTVSTACAAAVIGNILALVAVVILSARHDIGWGEFYRDVPATAGLRFTAGYLSNVGAVGWIASATALAMAALSVAGTPSARPLVTLAVLTAALGLDDLFMIHEGLLRSIGIPQMAMFAVHGVVALLLLRDLGWFLRTPIAPLALAFICLGLSVGTDIVSDIINDHGDVLVTAEDALKLLGISFWSVYAVGLSVAIVRRPSSAREASEVHAHLDADARHSFVAAAGPHGLGSSPAE